jgi:hypothetical protein
MTNTEKIAQLKTALREIWTTHVEPYLADPKDGKHFIALDRKVRALGVFDPPSAVEEPLTVKNAEFAVWEVHDNDDIDFFAQVDGPRETALEEARRYAAQITVIGNAAIIEEVTRREVERLIPHSSCNDLETK